MQSDRLQQQSSITLTSSKGCSYERDTLEQRCLKWDKSKFGEAVFKMLIFHAPSPWNQHLTSLTIGTRQCFRQVYPLENCILFRVLVGSDLSLAGASVLSGTRCSPQHLPDVCRAKLRSSARSAPHMAQGPRVGSRGSLKRCLGMGAGIWSPALDTASGL